MGVMLLVVGNEWHRYIGVRWSSENITQLEDARGDMLTTSRRGRRQGGSESGGLEGGVLNGSEYGRNDRSTTNHIICGWVDCEIF